MTGKSRETPADRESLKGLLETCRMVLAQERVALQGEILRAGEALANASPRAREKGGFDTALALVAQLEVELGRMEQSVGGLEKVFTAQTRLDRIDARLASLEQGAPLALPEEEREPPLEAEPLEPESEDAVLGQAPGAALPMAKEGVIDLQNAMVQRLRDQVARLREERGVLIINGRNTLASMIRVHQAVLGLLSATSYQDFLERLNRELPHIIDIHVIVLGIERSGPVAVTPELGNIRLLADGKVEKLFGPQRMLLLRRDVVGDPDLYGEQANRVYSDALVRLEIPGSGYEGVLAFGADDPDYFSDDQGTELLTFLGRSIEALIGKWSDESR